MIMKQFTSKKTPLKLLAIFGVAGLLCLCVYVSKADFYQNGDATHDEVQANCVSPQSTSYNGYRDYSSYWACWSCEDRMVADYTSLGFVVFQGMDIQNWATMTYCITDTTGSSCTPDDFIGSSYPIADCDYSMSSQPSPPTPPLVRSRRW